MSRLAKRPITLPSGVEAQITEKNVAIKGPKGHLELSFPSGITIKKEDSSLVVGYNRAVFSTSKEHGLYWALVRNMVEGVSKGYEIRLLLVGVGYKANLKGNDLDLQIGNSHPTLVPIPKGITVKVEKATEIIITGVDKQQIGQFAATVRSYKPPEPYKQKGIRYKTENVRKKAGKAAKSK